MPTIYDEALNGTLTATSLASYLAPDNTLIDREGGPNKITPLAAACLGGHLNVVQLLLSKKAKPNGPDSNKRTPFYFVTTRTPKDRSAIAEALINADPITIDFPCDEDGNTPLMNAITQIKDKDVIHLLVDKGASLTKENNNKETAQTLAKKAGLERHLKSKAERGTTRAQMVDLLVSVVSLIISHSNTLTKGVVKDGIVKKLYDISGSRDAELEKEIPEPKTVEDFKKNLDFYVKDSGLEKFFARGDPFLQTLAQKAAALKNDTSTDLGNTENIGKLTHVSLYEPVIYCDDSFSMKRQNRYTNQKILVTRIARIATILLPDELKGVELHFINSPSKGPKRHTAMDEAMDSVTPLGDTPIGTNLRLKILQPLVYNKISTTSTSLKRPLLVFMITDGMPSSEPREKLKQTILECKKTLVDAGYEATAVRFCLSQLGNSSKATDFLNELKAGGPRLKEVLHITTDQLDSNLNELKMNERRLETWVLKLLANPIMDRDMEED